MMNEMIVYKITLEPLDWFFFGGESTFDNSVKQSYIAHSNLFPQQTALLGMIRYQLLKQKGLLIRKGEKPDWKQIEELIGADSFIIDNPEQTFGVINGLSPVFVEKETIERTKKGNVPVVTAFFPVPLTKGYKLSFDKNVKVCLNGEQKNCLINDNDTYDAKKYDNYMCYQDKSGKQLELSKIFLNRMQIGITKDTDGGSKRKVRKKDGSSNTK